MRSDGARDYYYLATGLFGDVYNTSHNKQKAERYFMQALEEVGDRDPKFTMLTYLNLAEMLSLKAPQKALEWIGKAIAKAEDTKNIDYLSMSLAMKCYVLFLTGDVHQFFQVHNQYVSLRNTHGSEFNHRYDNMVEAAKLAFDNDYEKALQKVHEGSLAVDSSLVAIRIYAMASDMKNGFDAILRRYAELDSIYGFMQDANFNQMASETALLRSQEEAAANKKLASRLTYWLIGMTAVFRLCHGAQTADAEDMGTRKGTESCPEPCGGVRPDEVGLHQTHESRDPDTIECGVGFFAGTYQSRL